MAENKESSNSKVWAVMSLVAALGAAAVARKGMDQGWRFATGRKPPQNPADPDVSIREAVLWAIASGAAVALARMLVQRQAAHYYTRSTGHLPGQLEHDGE
ncbi:DUF4235 domain-containing protein [Nocardioides insulae]|uniref:DUF4235 domain-containing protein n=1 Tax=Nocardioides insulae TaxID=394734 RepID=UPI00048CEE03|nr:DUF4235 domain-containing protein [Nocardioides insulae]